MTASVTRGRALRYAGGSARGLLHHNPGHCLVTILKPACLRQYLKALDRQTGLRGMSL